MRGIGGALTQGTQVYSQTGPYRRSSDRAHRAGFRNMWSYRRHRRDGPLGTGPSCPTIAEIRRARKTIRSKERGARYSRRDTQKNNTRTRSHRLRLYIPYPAVAQRPQHHVFPSLAAISDPTTLVLSRVPRHTIGPLCLYFFCPGTM